MAQPSTIYVQLESLLLQYLGRMNALSILNRALAKHGLHPHSVQRENLRQLAPDLRSGLLLFADRVMRESILAKLQLLDGGLDSLPPPKVVSVKTEHDIAVARSVAKTMCESMGAPSLTAHTTATITSELTRNIVLYAGKGQLTFEGGRNPGSWIAITASDDGPGIESLNLILSGNYRSKTGMGKGLLGVRRLCDKFNVETGPNGTRVNVEVRW